MTLDVAQGQLKSIVDRILRLKEESDWQLARAIEDRVARLDYVLSPLAAIEGGPSVALDRAYRAGGQLLGVRTDVVHDRVRMIRRKGSLSAALKSLEQWMTWAPWDVSELDGDLFGFIYVMEAIDFPGVVKIGFSRSPRQRLNRLQREFRVNLRLGYQAPATEFDEHLVQHSMAPYGLAGEWFDLARQWERQIPEVRFYSAERMWNEMKEAA